MSYVNPNGQTAPSIGDVVLCVPLAPTPEMQSSFYGQVVSLDPGGVNARVRSTAPPNHVYLMGIGELQYSPYTAAQLRIGVLSSVRNYP